MNKFKWLHIAWLGLAIPNCLAEPLQVEVVQIKQNVDSVANYRTIAQVEPTYTYKEKAVSDGRVIQSLQQGDTFVAGQALIKANMLLLELTQKELQNQMHHLKLELNVIEKQYKRQKKLIKQKATSQEDMEKIELKIIKLKNDIQLIEPQISKTEWLLQQSQFIAPFNGVITKHHFSLGAAFEKGDVLIEAVSLDSKKIVIDIPTEIVNRGEHSAQLFSKGINYTISDIKFFPLNSSHFIGFRAVFDVSDLPVKLGEKVEVILDISKTLPQFEVPVNAVFHDHIGTSVFIAKEGKVEKQNVNIVSKSDSKLYIRGETLSDGQWLIINDHLLLSNGQEVSFKRSKNDLQQ